MPRPSRLWVFVTLFLGGLTLAATAQQTRNIGNLLGKTDANHALVITMAEAAEPYSAPRAIGNLLGKTDRNQALVVTCPDGSCGGDAYTTIADDGTPLPQRSTLNFAGAGVSCADDMDQTTCTVAGPHVFAVSVTESATPATTEETTLWSIPVPGGTLARDGEALRLTASGTCVASEDSNRTWRVRLGGTALFEVTADCAAWRLEVTIYRTDTDAQYAIGMFHAWNIPGGYANHQGKVGTSAVDLTTEQILTLTGQHSTAGGITFRAGTVEILR